MSWFKKSALKHTNGGTPPASIKTLLVSDYLSGRSVYLFPAGVSKEEMLFKLVSSLPVPDHSLALNAVLDREKMGGTIVDAMISIPHARLNNLRTIELAVGICSEAPKDQPRLYFLFLSPKEDTKIHLLFLSSLSSLFQTEGFVEQLLSSKAPHEIVQKIRQIEKGI